MIRAVVFDCFGVLTSDGWRPFAEKHFAQDSEKKRYAHDLSKRVDGGFLDYETFLVEIAKLANVSLETARDDIENNCPNEHLFSYIEQLKQSYKIGMLSNAGANWLTELFTPQQNQLFDAVVLSYEIGVIKPHPHAYHAICNKLNVDPQEVVFIDDIERYVTGAKDIGMNAIRFVDNDQLQKELSDLLIRHES